VKIRQKLLVCFFLFTLIVAAVGFVGLIASSQIAISFEGGEQNFRVKVSAATEIASHAKKAESHLMLYLLLHDTIDKSKFFNRYKSLEKEISLLDKIIVIPAARDLLDNIKFDANELLPTSKTLITIHDKEMKVNGHFKPEEHNGLIRSFHEITSSLRQNSMKLSHFATDFLNKQEAITTSSEISSLAKRAEGHLLLYLSLHEEIDKNKFFKRHESLLERIEILDSRLKNPEAIEMLKAIKLNVNKLLPVGNALIYRHDLDMKTLGKFQHEKRKTLLQMLHKVSSIMHEDGLKLANFNVQLESKEKEAAIEQSKNLQRIILSFIFASVFIALLLGYILSKTISGPILKLGEAAEKIGSGQLDTPIDIKTSDEIGNFAATLRKMTEDLQKILVSKAYIDNIITSMMNSLVVVNLSGKIRSVNRALCSMLNYSEEELIDYPIQKIFATEFHMDSELKELKESGQLKNTERVYLSKSGKRIPVIFSGSIIYDNSRMIQDAVFVALDISERKQAEEKLNESREQLRNLLAYLQSVREHERTEFSHEIHDELGQSLTALKMDIHWLRKKHKGFSSLTDKADSMLKIIDATIQTVKKICTELRPGILDHLGLGAAIEWQTIEFQKRSGIPCELNFNPEEIILDKDRSTAIFRILQETLTNIARHAEASAVNITIEKKASQLVMEVTDNGKGIKEENKNDAKSFGLIGMRERTLYLGGKFQIRGAQNQGTTVSVSIPIVPG
jgi:PAS domain S-box-containing protein